MGRSRKVGFRKEWSDSMNSNVELPPSKRRTLASIDESRPRKAVPKLTTRPGNITDESKSALSEAGFHVGSRLTSKVQVTVFLQEHAPTSPSKHVVARSNCSVKFASYDQKRKLVQCECEPRVEVVKADVFQRECRPDDESSIKVTDDAPTDHGATCVQEGAARSFCDGTSEDRAVQDDDHPKPVGTTTATTAEQELADNSAAKLTYSRASMEIEESSALKRFMERRKVRMRESKGEGEESLTEETRGLHLVTLLLLCASAIDKQEMQTGVVALAELCRRVTENGDTMQRLAVYFAEGLGARLVRRSSAAYEKLMGCKVAAKMPEEVAEVWAAAELAEAAANQAIASGAAWQEVVHVIDIAAEGGGRKRWKALLQALAARPGGAPKLVKITAAIGIQCGETTSELAKIADKLALRLQFEPVADVETALSKASRGRSIKEAVVVTSILHLHVLLNDESGSRIKRILRKIRSIEPELFVMIEQETSLNSATFLGRFAEALHYYAAVFDSIAASLPPTSHHRAALEGLFFAPRIKNLVACEGAERYHRPEPISSWLRRLQRGGFRPLPLVPAAAACLRHPLLHDQGYRLLPHHGLLSITWKDTTLLTCSAWTCSHNLNGHPQPSLTLPTFPNSYSPPSPMGLSNFSTPL